MKLLLTICLLLILGAVGIAVYSTLQPRPYRPTTPYTQASVDERLRQMDYQKGLTPCQMVPTGLALGGKVYLPISGVVYLGTGRYTFRTEREGLVVVLSTHYAAQGRCFFRY